MEPMHANAIGVAFGASVVVPGFYAAYMAGLDAVPPYRYTQLVLLAFRTVLAAVAAWVGPETSGVNLARSTSTSRAPTRERP